MSDAPDPSTTSARNRVTARTVRVGATVTAVVVMVAGIAIVLDRRAPSRRPAVAASTTSTRPARARHPVALAPVTSSTRPDPRPRRPSPLGAAVMAYLRGRQGIVTIAVRDLLTGQAWLYRPGDAQATASVVKVDIMAALLSQATATSKPLSSTQTTELQQMIELSDNDAATALWNAVGGAAGVRAFNGRVGLTETSPSSCVECPNFPWPGWGLTTTTPSDQIKLLELLARPNRVLTPAARALALDLMDNITPSERWGVSSGVPASVPVALKNGWLPLRNDDWQINSVGWIRGQQRNYMLAILTTGNPYEGYGIQTAGRLGALIWQELAPDRGPSTFDASSR